MRLAIPLLLSSAACDDRPRQWDAMIYLEGGGWEPYQNIRGFKTLELCRQAGIEQVRRLPPPIREKAAYDCGYMCGFDPDYGHTMCEKSSD